MAVFEELSNASEFEEQIANLQGQIDSLDDTYATDTDIQGLQGQIDTLEETVAGLGSGGSGASVKSQMFSITNISDIYSFLQNNMDKVLYIQVGKDSPSLSINCNTVTITSSGATFGSESVDVLTTSGRQFYYPDFKSITNVGFGFTQCASMTTRRLYFGSSYLMFTYDTHSLTGDTYKITNGTTQDVTKAYVYIYYIE